MDIGDIQLKMRVDLGQLDAAKEKVGMLRDLLKEAKSLMDDMASSLVAMKFEID